jgi:hypothetical protein
VLWFCFATTGGRAPPRPPPPLSSGKKRPAPPAARSLPPVRGDGTWSRRQAQVVLFQAVGRGPIRGAADVRANVRVRSSVWMSGWRPWQAVSVYPPPFSCRPRNVKCLRNGKACLSARYSVVAFILPLFLRSVNNSICLRRLSSSPPPSPCGTQSGD